jgi:mycothiol synthase
MKRRWDMKTGAENIVLPDAPRLPSLTFRHLQGEQDYPRIAALITASKTVDGIERSISAGDVARLCEHLVNCNPGQDMLLAEADRQVIACGLVHWTKQTDGAHLYHLLGWLHPEWRHRGIGTAMWRYGEHRLREVAAGHPGKSPRFFQCVTFESEKDLIALLDEASYRPVRYETHMVRDLDQPIPLKPMPSGLEVRPVKQEEIWPIVLAMKEAFLDAWGARDPGREELEAWMREPTFTPKLWKVAWDHDQVAGSILNFINHDENREYGRKRGYTEDITTRRPWRKRGLASALLAQSMQMFKDMGMTETALSVDSENLSGALQLYESLGYRKVKQQIIYRKPMD